MIQEFNSKQESQLKNYNSHKVNLKDFEEFGIREEDFSNIFESKPVYTLAEFGNYLYGDFSEILTLI